MPSEHVQQRLDQLKGEYEEIVARRYLEEYDKRVQAHKAVLKEATGEVVDRTEYLKDTPGFFMAGINRLSLPENLKDGDFSPFFRTEQELQVIRGQGLYLGTAHPVGIGLIDDLTNYTISTGFKYSVRHKDNSVLDEEVLYAVQEFLDGFNEYLDELSSECSFERELFKQSRVLGECFMVLNWDEEQQRVDFRIARPEWVREPTEKWRMEEYGADPKWNWRYGIATKDGRSERPQAYWIMWNGEQQRVKLHLPDEVIHCKLNVPQIVKRGLSDFYGVEAHLEDHAALLKNTVRGAALQASIALIREHQTGMRGAEVESLISGNGSGSIQLPPLPGGSGLRQRKIRSYDTGSVLDVVGSKYYPGPLGAPNGPTYVEIGQAIIRIVGARWSMPEHMISNAISGAGGARAAIVETGTPFARATRTRQQIYAKIFREIMWKGLKFDMAHAPEKYGDVTFMELKEQLEIKVNTPDPTQRNEAEQHLVLSGRHQAGVISMQTWRETIGVDHQTESERVEQEQAVAFENQMQQQDAMMQQQQDAMGQMANAPNEVNQKEANGQQPLPRDQRQGAGAESTPPDRTSGPVSAKKSMAQKLAAGRAGKNVEPLGR